MKVSITPKSKKIASFSTGALAVALGVYVVACGPAPQNPQTNTGGTPGYSYNNGYSGYGNFNSISQTFQNAILGTYTAYYNYNWDGYSYQEPIQVTIVRGGAYGARLQFNSTKIKIDQDVMTTSTTDYSRATVISVSTRPVNVQSTGAYDPFSIQPNTGYISLSFLVQFAAYTGLQQLQWGPNPSQSSLYGRPDPSIVRGQFPEFF